MYYMLRQIARYEQQGKAIAIRSTFKCASAAAILLAMGHWGERRVDQSTVLLLHTLRIDSNLKGMTATLSGSLSQSLTSADFHLLDILVQRMLDQSGSEAALIETVNARFKQVERNWSELETKLCPHIISNRRKSRPDWFRSLAKLDRAASADGKFTSDLRKYLYERMQSDFQMDLREAYVLCLIDQIDDVLSFSEIATGSKLHLLDAAAANDKGQNLY
jgi:hypothetical protein